MREFLLLRHGPPIVHLYPMVIGRNQYDWVVAVAESRVRNNERDDLQFRSCEVQKLFRQVTRLLGFFIVLACTGEVERFPFDMNPLHTCQLPGDILQRFTSRRSVTMDICNECRDEGCVRVTPRSRF